MLTGNARQAGAFARFRIALAVARRDAAFAHSAARAAVEAPRVFDATIAVCAVDERPTLANFAHVVALGAATLIAGAL